MDKKKGAGPRVTISDVAAAAGVSITSVSCVLNGRSQLSMDTEQNIRKVMDKLGYVPRPHQVRASSRRVSRVREKSARFAPMRRGLVVVLASDARIASVQSPQASIITAAASEWLAEFGHDIVLAAALPHGRVPLCLESTNLRGVLLQGGGTLSPAQRSALAEIPCVEFFGEDRPVKWDQVVVDDQSVGRLAFEALHQKGCDHFVICNPGRLNFAFSTRASAFRFSAMEAGYAADMVEVREGERIPIAAIAEKRRGRLGVFIAGQNGANTLAEMDQRMREAGLDETGGVHRVGVSTGGACPHDVIHLSLERLGQMCAQQLVWRMQQPAAEFQRILIRPRLRKSGDLETRYSFEPHYLQ